jgi:hypothetical protein
MNRRRPIIRSPRWHLDFRPIARPLSRRSCILTKAHQGLYGKRLHMTNVLQPDHMPALERLTMALSFQRYRWTPERLALCTRISTHGFLRPNNHSKSDGYRSLELWREWTGERRNWPTTVSIFQENSIQFTGIPLPTNPPSMRNRIGTQKLAHGSEGRVVPMPSPWVLRPRNHSP